MNVVEQVALASAIIALIGLVVQIKSMLQSNNEREDKKEQRKAEENKELANSINALSSKVDVLLLETNGTKQEVLIIKKDVDTLSEDVRKLERKQIVLETKFEMGTNEQ